MGSNPATTWVADVRRRWPEHLVDALVALCQQREFSQLLQPEGPLNDLELRTRFGNPAQAMYRHTSGLQIINEWVALDLSVVQGSIALAFPGHGPGIEQSGPGGLQRFMKANGFRRLNKYTWLPPKAACEGCERFLSCVLQRSEVAG